MISHVHIKNYRSFVDANVDLQPFSLVVGANGSGKSNLLRFFEALCREAKSVATGHGRGYAVREWRKHVNLQEAEAGFLIGFSDNVKFEGIARPEQNSPVFGGPKPQALTRTVAIFNLIPDAITGVEKIQPNATVAATGTGTTLVLDMLKNGDREDLFDHIEAHFRRYVPEVEKLSLQTMQDGQKQIQVREKGLKVTTPGPELSEGTRLILCVLTIIHQEKPPPIILLEDIDRGMHPRLFEYIAPLMKDIAVRTGVNILATTHNPYLVDAFQDDKKAVIIVEKKDGASTLSTLEQKLEGLNYEEVDPDDLPLGQLWYSGLVGGTPEKISHRVKA